MSESVLKNTIRHGNFTSSEIVRLLKTGTYWTYIEEKNMERCLGRSLDDESEARALTWGKLGEKRVFDILPPTYVLSGSLSIQHPSISEWTGTPDLWKSCVACDVKCPKTMKSFCQLVGPAYEKGKKIHDALTIEAVRHNHKDGDKFYYQVVSNAVLLEENLGMPFNRGELIVYMPFKTELEELRAMAQQSTGEELSMFSWVVFAQNDSLPHLVEGGQYNNLNHIEFEIPQADKDLLKEKVLEARKYLI